MRGITETISHKSFSHQIFAAFVKQKGLEASADVLHIKSVLGQRPCGIFLTCHGNNVDPFFHDLPSPL